MERYAVVGLGGFLGACARYWLSSWAAQRWGAGFPLGTLIINATGSFVLGLILGLSTERLPLDPRWRLFLAVGFLGSYTTFSTYTVDSVELLLAGQWRAGAANLVGSNLIGLAAAILGLALGRRA